MNRRKLLVGIWLTLSLLLSLTAYTMYFVAQMRFSILLYSYTALALSQIFSLVVFLIGSDKLKNKLLSIFYKLCCLASLAVLPALAFIFSGLLSQYHANIKNAVYVPNASYETILPEDKTKVYMTDDFYVFFPEYSDVSLVCGERPSRSDESITWCCGAAFQHEIELGFSDSNIEGYHASDGIYSDSPYIHDGMAAFVFYDNKFSFEFDELETAVKEAAAQGGSGFMQYALLKDGEIVSTLKMPRVRSFRALAELNGNLCIIDSIEMMHFDDFLSGLKTLGVTDAIYMDMGAGWNYSWYRTASGNAVSLFFLKVPWSHNWIVFKK